MYVEDMIAVLWERLGCGTFRDVLPFTYVVLHADIACRIIQYLRSIYSLEPVQRMQSLLLQRSYYVHLVLRAL